MSYDIYLKDPESNAVLELEDKHQFTGGTYVLGGAREAWLNVTYNYSKHFYRVMNGGIRSIYGMTGEDSLPILMCAIDKLKNDTSDDYWEATEGNARNALIALEAMARRAPTGVWAGD